MVGIVENPLVSIVINCYNGEEFLRDAIESVYAQSYTNWEIIFWDNASTDTSASIAQSYGEKIGYHLATENTTLGQARNFAVAHAKGKYIAFIDCDDIWLANKLEKQVRFMEENSEYAMCYGGIEEIDLQGKHFRNWVTKYKSGYILEEQLFQFDFNMLTSFVRRDIWHAEQLFVAPEITVSIEYWLYMHLASKYKIGVINEVLAQYRVHDSALTNKSVARHAFERRFSLNSITKKYPELLEKYPQAFREAYARANYYEAKYFMSIKNQIAAFKSMRGICFLNIRYTILTLVTLAPFNFWDRLHKIFRNRTI